MILQSIFVLISQIVAHDIGGFYNGGSLACGRVNVHYNHIRGMQDVCYLACTLWG